MISYIEKTLHCSVKVREYAAPRNIPLLISENYILKSVEINGLECIFAEPVPELHLSTLRKQQKQLEKVTGMWCVLCLRRANAYTKEHLIEEGIPFIVEEKQIYLPFMGVSLSDKRERIFKPARQISFLTQKLLLISLYESWREVSVSEAAERLAVTKMSITRCYDEIEVFELPYIRKKSRARLFSAENDRKRMWENLQGILRNPVLQQFVLKDDLKEPRMLSGLSAVSFYTMLGDSVCPIYSVPKKEIKKVLTDYQQIFTMDDSAGCRIQEVGYEIIFEKGIAADPLSTALMLTDSEKKDPRVEKAVDEMLEEFVWSKG